MGKQGGLKWLMTPFGVRSLLESVSYCNRCGMCAAVCPVYQQYPQESNSPRGRNQAVRLLLEGKLKVTRDRRALSRLAFSCTLCGKCTQACPGKIPTAEHILQLRRRLNQRVLPVVLSGLLRLRADQPRVFLWLIRGGLLLKRLHLLWGIAWVPGFNWVYRINELLSEPSFPVFVTPAAEKPTLIYVPSLEAEFLMPALAQKTYQLATKKKQACVWQNTSSGLYEYVYGDMRRAKKIMRGLIARHARTGNGKLPVLTDSINVYLFWQRVPQLFEGLPGWQAKARHFAKCVRFVTDYMPKKVALKPTDMRPVLLANSSLFTCEGEPFVQTEEILRTHFKKNFVQCGYEQAGVPPFGYGFTKPADFRPFIVAVQTLAKHQAHQVFVLDGLAALELKVWLRRFYPTARVRHIIQLG